METAIENNANGNVNLDKLKDALDKSSSINSALGLSFSIIIFYLAVTVAATTDKDLFIPDSGFSVPFLDLKLGVVNFFLAAPFIVLILHYNLLYNLMQHSKKLLRWHNANKNMAGEPGILGDAGSAEDIDMYPFLFNFALNVKNSTHNRTLNLVIRISLFMLPLAFLCFVLIRFADYQSIPITLWHFMAVLLDATLIATHGYSILQVIKTQSEPVKENYRFIEFFNFSKQGHGLKMLWKNSGTLLFNAFPALFASLVSFFLTFLAGIWNLITKLKFWKPNVFKSAISNQAILYKYLRIETFMIHLATLFVGFFIYIMVIDVDFRKDEELPYQSEGYSKLDSTIFRIKSFPYKFQKSILPMLSLREAILVKSQPEQQVIQLHLNRNIDETERKKIKLEIMETFTVAYNLKGRSFRYADLSQTNLTKTDFREADLTFADLSRAEMQNANMHNAIMPRAILNYANLKRAFLFDVNFQGAKFALSNLQEANLSGANLQGAYLYGANLQGADLTYCNLQEAYLTDAYLQKAYFNEAKLQGVVLENANFQEANLSNANLQGANLSYANLQKADFFQAKLQGANLRNANLQEAQLNSAGLQGAVLNGTRLQWLTLSQTNFQGADLRYADLQGATLNETSLRGSIFSEDFSDTFFFICESNETSTPIFDRGFERYLDSIATLIADTILRSKFRNRMIQGKERFDNEKENLTIVQRLPKAKIYRPEDLETDSTFYHIRRRIADESEEIAKSMLERSSRYSGGDSSLYNDLYKYIKAHHPDYLEGFKFDENGDQIRK